MSRTRAPEGSEPHRHGARTEGDPQRLREGWERRFVADPRRAEEARELYARLGYEVCLDPVGPDDLESGCEDCRLVQLLGFKTVYVRRPPQATPS